MENDNLQEHLNKGIYGVPLLNPDEQRKYLGTFRERVSLSITFNEFSINPDACFCSLNREISTNEHNQIIIKINGNLQSNLINRIIQISKDNKIKFEYLSDSSLPHNDYENAVVVCSPNKALHIDVVDASKKYTECFAKKTSSIAEEKDKSKNIFEKLFNL